MNLQKLNPWNWFKHEESGKGGDHQIPVTRAEAGVVAAPASYPIALSRLHREMDQLFDDVFNGFGMPSIQSGFASPPAYLQSAGATNGYWPLIDVSGDEKSYEIALDVPGLSEADLSIELKGDALIIKGEKEESSEHKDKQFYRVERSYGSFQRTLSLPDDADSDAIKASLNKGVLSLTIPRREAADEDVKSISINS